MRDRLERFVLLPFTAGCISDSSIPVVIQHTKRSKLDTNSTPTGKHDEEEYSDEGSLLGESWKTSLPRLQKLLKNLSQLFVYKDELEPETGMEIGLPRDVTHMGLDGSTSSFFSKGWKSMAEPELINLHSFPLKQLELGITAQDETGRGGSFLETKCEEFSCAKLDGTWK